MCQSRRHVRLRRHKSIMYMDEYGDDTVHLEQCVLIRRYHLFENLIENFTTDSHHHWGRYMSYEGR